MHIDTYDMCVYIYAHMYYVAPAPHRLVSNDPSVQQWFTKIVWLLALHSQTRITSFNMRWSGSGLGLG